MHNNLPVCWWWEALSGSHCRTDGKANWEDSPKSDWVDKVIAGEFWVKIGQCNLGKNNLQVWYDAKLEISIHSSKKVGESVSIAVQSHYQCVRAKKASSVEHHWGGCWDRELFSCCIKLGCTYTTMCSSITVLTSISHEWGWSYRRCRQGLVKWWKEHSSCPILGREWKCCDWDPPVQRECTEEVCLRLMESWRQWISRMQSLCGKSQNSRGSGCLDIDLKQIKEHTSV